MPGLSRSTRRESGYIILRSQCSRSKERLEMAAILERYLLRCGGKATGGEPVAYSVGVQATPNHTLEYGRSQASLRSLARAVQRER